MFRVLRRLFTSNKKCYEYDKKTLSTQSEKERSKLAADSKTNPEMLYYMADDASDKVRAAIAGNKSTPMHVSPKLAKDPSVDVRLMLANRLVSLLPDLSKAEHGQLYSFAVQALGTLAEDEVLKIRRALSTALKDLTYSPPKVVIKLAQDVEREISEPLLKHCLRIPDKDLLDILGHHPESWVAEAIATRKTISAKLSKGIFKTKNLSAGKILLANKSAKISNETLEEIIEYARTHAEWHENIALRPDLTFELARKLVGFAGRAVFMILEKRKDFDKTTRQDIAELLKRRMAFKDNELSNEPVENHVKRYVDSKTLDSETLLDALAWHNFEFILESMSQLSGIPKDKIDNSIKQKDTKLIVAIIWKANLPMRFAVELQQKMANIQPKNLVYARGGTDFPFTNDEMEQKLNNI